MHNTRTNFWGSWEAEIKSTCPWGLYLALCAIYVNYWCPPSVCTTEMTLPPQNGLSNSDPLIFGVCLLFSPLLITPFAGLAHLELWFSSWEMSSTMSFSDASWAMALQSLQATRALAMASSPCCQKNRAIFCLFIRTAHTISSWKGKGKWLISGSSRSMSTSSSRFLVVFLPRLKGTSSCHFRETTEVEWEMSQLNISNSYLLYIYYGPCSGIDTEGTSLSQYLSQKHSCLTLKQVIISA